MIVKVDCSMQKQLEAFLDYVKARVADPVHKPNANVIADFVDKFLVVELKRLGSKDESYQEEIEFPEELVLEPLKEAKSRMDDIFNDFLKNRGAPATSTAPVTTSKIKDPPPFHHETPTKSPRNGNGHKKEKIRSLLDGEKDHIRSRFMGHNGQIAEDLCVAIKQDAAIGTEVGIFQVTGFVTYLHKLIAMGRLVVGDMDAYLKFLQGHRSLWSTWNSPKYQAMRAAAAPQPAVANSIPKFTAFPKR